VLRILPELPAGPPDAKDGAMSTTDLAGQAPWLAGVRRVAVLTGAGISTDSGIPDFRGPQGIWTRNPAAEKLSTYQNYVSDPELRQRSWQNRLAHPAWQARPNAAHLALARLTASDVDTQVITQNIDGLHQKAGTPPDRVIELHGTMHATACVSCGDSTSMAEALARVRGGEADPACAQCGGILKSATVMFGQALDPEVFGRAVAAARACDLFLAVGSTLTVEPAASLCGIAVQGGARLIIVNHDPTPYDPLATATIRQPIGEAIPGLVAAVLARAPTPSREAASPAPAAPAPAAPAPAAPPPAAPAELPTEPR
jgi:NAD-dependent protein deacetylase/lipoamidase